MFKYEVSFALLFRSGSHSRVFPFTVDEKGCFVYTGNRKQAQKRYPKVSLSGGNIGFVRPGAALDDVTKVNPFLRLN